MGVPKLHSSIKKIWPDISSRVSGDLNCDHLCVDMGSVLHTCISNSNTEDELISNTKNYICTLMDMANPKKTVYLAFDGVPPITKVYEQAVRRAANANNKESLRRDILSPGTKFMDRIGKEMEKMEPPIKNIKIIASTSLCAGEGEQKLIQYVKEMNKSSVIFYGADSDLVILSLQLDSKIMILKENYWSANVFELVDIEQLKHNLDMEYSFSTKQKLYDVILVFCLLGNDYIPKPFNLEVSPERIKSLLYNLQQLHLKKLYLVKEGTADISQDALIEFSRNLDDSEFTKYKSTYPLSKSQSTKEALTLSLNNLSLGERKTKIKNHLESVLRRRYDTWNFELTKNFSPTIKDQQQCSEDYVTGLQWVLKYYLNNENIRYWSFAYNSTGPLVQNIYKGLNTPISKRFAELPETIKPCPLEHLCLILPSSSSSMVPEKYQDLVKKGKKRSTYEGLFDFHESFQMIK